jgi:uncharacterized membrane protein YbhN (UPF0104 family)
VKRFARLAGVLLAGTAAVFFLSHAQQGLRDIDLHALATPRAAMGFAAMLGIYLLQIPLTTVSWRLMLDGLGVRLTGLQAYGVLATTQFGKYLPGNIAQHLGRVTVASRLGGDLTRVGLTLVYENVIALLVGIHITLLFALWRPMPALEHWLPRERRMLLLVLITLGALAALRGVPAIAAWLIARRSRGTAGHPAPMALSTPRIGLSYLLFMVNFATMGLGFTVLAQSLFNGAPVSFVAMTGAFAAAWVSGLLVPGAPAGIGIREGVLFALLSGQLPVATSVAAIGLLRIGTTAGDLLHLLLGGWCLRISRRAGVPLA